MSEVARLAHIGKGTVYLYWETKEELIAQLFVRDFLALIEEVMDKLVATPEIVVPHVLLPLMHRATRERPFLAALQTRDKELLGYFEDHPSIRTLMNTLGPGAFLARVLPVLRSHGLARKDTPLGSQIYGGLAVLNGFFSLPITYPFAVEFGGEDVDPDAVLTELCRLILEPAESPAPDAIVAAANGVWAALDHAHRAVVAALSVDKDARRRSPTGMAVADLASGHTPEPAMGLNSERQ